MMSLSLITHDIRDYRNQKVPPLSGCLVRARRYGKVNFTNRVEFVHKMRLKESLGSLENRTIPI